MNISSLVSNKYSGLALAGTAGSTTLGLTFIRSGNKDIEQLPKPEYALNAETSNSYTCFGKMFSGVSKPNPSESSSGNFDANQEQLGKIQGPTNSEKQDAVGCAWMGITGVRALNEYVNVEEKHYIFDFDAEVVVKNENVGGSLSVEAAGYKTQACADNDCKTFTPVYVQRAKYTLFLLEKGAGAGSIKSGYSGYDSNLGAKDKPSIYIASPFDDGLTNDQAQATLNNRLDSKVKDRKYLGLGKSTNKGQREIFQEIKLGDETRTKFEVFGRVIPFNDSKENEGYKKTYTVWKSDKDWFRFKGKTDGSGDTVDISSILGEGYAPFKGVNGSGIGVEEYCNSSNKDKVVCAPKQEPKKN